MTSPQPTPLALFLPVASAFDQQLSGVLVDAANDATARLTSLAGKDGVGAQVRRAQLARVRAALGQTAEGLWQGASADLVVAAGKAGQAAAAAATNVDKVLFRAFPTGIPPGLAAAHRAQAQYTVSQYLARTANGIPLSEQVYRTQRLASGFIDQQINRSLLLGESWKEMADRVRDSIRPDTKGGVAYAAKRLGRTEINNAFHTAQINAHRDEPWVYAYKWHLSGSHPKADICNDYAEKGHFDGAGPGEWKKEEIPGKPHPQCLCYTTAVTVDEDQFVKGFLDGNYDKYLDEKVYKYAPKSQRPC